MYSAGESSPQTWHLFPCVMRSFFVSSTRCSQDLHILVIIHLFQQRGRFLVWSILSSKEAAASSSIVGHFYEFWWRGSAAEGSMGRFDGDFGHQRLI